MTGYIEDERGVAVTYKNGGEYRRAAGDALIGADGVRSMVRSRMYDIAVDKPSYTGHTAWRTLLSAAELPEFMRLPVANLWLGERAHIVHYPLRGGSIVNVVALVEDSWRGNGESGDPNFWDHEGDWKFLANRFKDWSKDAHEVIRPGNSWLRWPLFDRPPIPSWSRGRVALLGDAAHPMLALPRPGRGSGDRGRQGFGRLLRRRAGISCQRAGKLLRGAHGARQPHSIRLARSRNQSITCPASRLLRATWFCAHRAPPGCCRGRTGFTRLEADEAFRSTVRLG